MGEGVALVCGWYFITFLPSKLVRVFCFGFLFYFQVGGWGRLFLMVSALASLSALESASDAADLKAGWAREWRWFFTFFPRWMVFLRVRKYPWCVPPFLVAPEESVGDGRLKRGRRDESILVSPGMRTRPDPRVNKPDCMMREDPCWLDLCVRYGTHDSSF